MPTSQRDPTIETPKLELRLLDGFSLRDHTGIIDVPPAGERVLALVALRGGSAHRSHLAGTLWPDSADNRAVANLRSTMWRMPEKIRTQLERHGTTVNFEGAWEIDVELCRVAAEQINKSGTATADQRALLTKDLLPYWDCEWLPSVREQHRQLRLHALESLGRAHLETGQPLEAVDTAMTVIADSPLRESAQLLLMQAHLEAGNRPAVVRHYGAFCDLLARELGLSPSDEMHEVAVRAGVHFDPINASPT